MNKLSATIGLFALLSMQHFHARSDSEPSPTSIAASISESNLSSGFEARLRVTRPSGDSSSPLKLSVIGQIEPDRTRMAIRVISPENLRGQIIVAQQLADGKIEAQLYQANSEAKTSNWNPYAQLYGTQLVLADMFASWWRWPKQERVERTRVEGHDCIVFNSTTGSQSTPVRYVESCVDIANKISWRTRIFDSSNELMRTMLVEKAIRKEHGALTAKRIQISSQDGGETTVEVYSGDEHYSIPKDTFAAFEQTKEITK